MRRDRHGDQPARRLVGHGRDPARLRPASCRSAPPLFGQLSLQACAEWLWSGWPVRFPDLKIAMSEGGIGWVAMLIDRLDNIVDRSGYGLGLGRAAGRRAAARTSGSARSTTPRRSTPATRIGIDHIMVEVDYPHGDGTWPDTQAVIEKAGATSRRRSAVRCAARTRPDSSPPAARPGLARGLTRRTLEHARATGPG